MIKTKGQSAMEYLMTYGWAILVVMVVGIAMWQLGIFNMGSSATTMTGFPKLKPQLAGTGLTADGVFNGVFTNGIGTKIKIYQVVVKDKSTGNIICCAQETPTVGGFPECAIGPGDSLISVAGTEMAQSMNDGAPVASGENFEVKLGSGNQCLVAGAKKGSVYNIEVQIGYDVTISGQTTYHTDSGTIRGALE